MTLAEARQDLLDQARLDADLYKGITLNAEGEEVEELIGATDLISRACTWWSKQTWCNYEPSVALTLTADQATYDCRNTSVVSKKVLEPRRVVINSTTLYRRDGREYGLWSIDDLTIEFPGWRTATSGTPFAAVWLPTNKLILHQPPSAVYTGTNFIEGWTLPDILVAGADDDDELPVPEEDHMAIVRLAYTIGAMPTVSEGEAWNRLSAMDAWWKDHAVRRAVENRTAFSGYGPRGSRNDWIR